MIKLTVEGKPATKGRPRFDPRTRRTYSPPSNIIAETDVRSVWREAGSPRFEEKPPLVMDVKIIVVRPDSHFKKDGSLSAEGLRHPYPENKKPDVDNAIKLIMDALNTRAYKDDVQITKATVDRVWGDWPLTEIVINERVNVFMP